MAGTSAYPRGPSGSQSPNVEGSEETPHGGGCPDAVGVRRGPSYEESYFQPVTTRR